MADDSDNAYLNNLLTSLAQTGVGAAGSLASNQAIQQAYGSVLQNLKDRFSDYSNLAPAGYQSITPQKLGPSALSGIQNDAASRGDEQNAIAQLQQIADSGGLNLSDKAALNSVQENLNRNNAARSNATANQFAARGQLGSGAQLAMDLSNNQNATQSANQQGESIAAQAQQRAMQAILNKAQASRTMGQDDYQKKAAAAQATDAIARYNAGMATDASKYNNTIKGQAYDDTLAKLRGETGLTDSMNTALLGSGKQQAGLYSGLAYGGNNLINGLSRGLNGGSGSKGNGNNGSSGNGDGSNNGDSGIPNDQLDQYPGQTGSSDSNNYGGTKLTDDGTEDGFDSSFLDSGEGYA